MFQMPTPGYLAWFVLIQLIRSVTPISYAFLTYVAYSQTWNDVFESEHSISIILFTIWMVLEAIFLPYHLLVHEKLQILRNPTHACDSLEERKALLQRCLDAIALASGHDDPDLIQAAHFDFLSRWFHGAAIADVRRENLEASGVVPRL